MASGPPSYLGTDFVSAREGKPQVNFLVAFTPVLSRLYNLLFPRHG